MRCFILTEICWLGGEKYLFPETLEPEFHGLEDRMRARKVDYDDVDRVEEIFLVQRDVDEVRKEPPTANFLDIHDLALVLRVHKILVIDSKSGWRGLVGEALGSRVVELLEQRRLARLLVAEEHDRALGDIGWGMRGVFLTEFVLLVLRYGLVPPGPVVIGFLLRRWGFHCF